MGSKPPVLEWKSPPSGKPGGPVLVARLGRLEIELRDVPGLARWEATARVTFAVLLPSSGAGCQDAVAGAEAALPEVLREALTQWEGARARRDAEAKKVALVTTRYTPEQVAALKVGDPVGVYADAALLYMGKVRRRYPGGKLLICYKDRNHKDQSLTVRDHGRAVWSRYYQDPRYIGPPVPPEVG